MDTNIIYLTDRSRIVTREECQAKRFYNYDYIIDGQFVGLQRREGAIPLLNGEWIHEGHARVLIGQPLDAVVEEIRTRYAEEVNSKGVFGEFDTKGLIREQTNLLEGMLRAFALIQMPRILEEYDVYSIEEGWDWVLAPGLVQKIRMDAILRRKGDGLLHILDYKAIPYASEDWTRKHERTRQTSLYIQALKERFGEDVGGIIYVGTIKGTRRKDTAKSSPFFDQKIQASPYLYAYALHGGDVGNVYQTAYTNKKGFVKIRTYDEMSMKEWIEWLWHNERNTLYEQFAIAGPMSPTPRELLRVKELVVREELTHVRRLKTYRDMLRRAGEDPTLLKQAQEYFDYVLAPKREEACYKYGADNACPFLGICFNEGATPLEDGEFEPRVSHHSTELEEKVA